MKQWQDAVDRKLLPKELMDQLVPKQLALSGGCSVLGSSSDFTSPVTGEGNQKSEMEFLSAQGPNARRYQRGKSLDIVFFLKLQFLS